MTFASSSDIYLQFPLSQGFITSIKGTTIRSNFEYTVFSPSPSPSFKVTFANLKAQTTFQNDNYQQFTARIFSDTLTPGTPVSVLFHRHKVEVDVSSVCPIVYAHLEEDRTKSFSGHCWINDTNSACIVQLSIDLKWWPYHQNIENIRLQLYYGIDETCTFSHIDPIYFQQEYIEETIPETGADILPEAAKFLRGKRSDNIFENNLEEQTIDEDTINFNHDLSENFHPKLRNLGFVSLVPDKTNFQETKEDQNVLIYFPKVAYAPGSLFRIPIKLQAGSKLHSFNISLNLKKRNDVKSKAIIAQNVNDSSWTIAMNSKPINHLVQVSSEFGHAHSGILHLFDWWFVIEEKSQVRDSIRLPFVVEYTLNGGQKIMNKVVISVSVQQDRICGIVTILDSNKFVNLASLNGIEQKYPVVVYAASYTGHHYNVTAQATCQSTDELVIQTGTACLNILINKKTTKPSDGTKIIARYGRHSTEFTVSVFVADTPMRIELSDARLQQIAAWFVASTDDGEDFNSTSHNCQLKFQSTLIDLYATFHTNTSYTQPLLITPYFLDHMRIVDTSVARLRNQFIIDGLKPGKTDIEVYSHDNVTLASHLLKVSGEKVHLVSMSTTLVEDINISVQPIDNQIKQLFRQDQDNSRRKRRRQNEAPNNILEKAKDQEGSQTNADRTFINPERPKQKIFEGTSITTDTPKRRMFSQPMIYHNDIGVDNKEIIDSNINGILPSLEACCYFDVIIDMHVARVNIVNRWDVFVEGNILFDDETIFPLSLLDPATFSLQFFETTTDERLYMLPSTLLNYSEYNTNNLSLDVDLASHDVDYVVHTTLVHIDAFRNVEGVICKFGVPEVCLLPANKARYLVKSELVFNKEMVLESNSDLQLIESDKKSANGNDEYFRNSSLNINSKVESVLLDASKATTTSLLATVVYVLIAIFVVVILVVVSNWLLYAVGKKRLFQVKDRGVVGLVEKDWVWIGPKTLEKNFVRTECHATLVPDEDFICGAVDGGGIDASRPPQLPPRSRNNNSTFGGSLGRSTYRSQSHSNQWRRSTDFDLSLVRSTHPIYLPTSDDISSLDSDTIGSGIYYPFRTNPRPSHNNFVSINGAEGVWQRHSSLGMGQIAGRSTRSFLGAKETAA